MNNSKITSIDLTHISDRSNARCVTVWWQQDNMEGNLHQIEEQVGQVLNQVATPIMEDAISRLDVNEKTIQVGGVTYYNCGGTYPQTYHTMYGPVDVERNMYQTSSGGKRYCPLEIDGRMVKNATPLLADIVARKSTEMTSRKVKDDLLRSNFLPISATYITNLTNAVGEKALEEQENWTYTLPDNIKANDVSLISIGIDGTFLNFSDGNEFREATVGSISLLDSVGNRLHTIRIGSAPEYGRRKFFSLLDKEWKTIKDRFPHALTQGLADGARCNWTWLTEHTDVQLLDFYHLSLYIGKAAEAIFGSKESSDAESFMDDWCSYIKHHSRGVYAFIEELTSYHNSKGKKIDKKSLKNVIDFLDNQVERTNYKKALDNCLPIGSGVTEATCKSLIKARLCQSGMRWTYDGASYIIALRALVLTAGRYEQFWKKIMQHGGVRR
jgi:hypothetical protein